MFYMKGYEQVIRRERVMDLGKVWVSGIGSFCFFAQEWTTISTFGAMLTAFLFIKRQINPMYSKIITSIETDEEDKNFAKVQTMRGKFILNINTITPLTDVYPAYRALNATSELLHNENLLKPADFEDEFSKNNTKLIRAYLSNIKEDTLGNMFTIRSGAVINYHELTDRFHFYFRHGDEVFVIGFPFTQDISFDTEELMRVLSGNKQLKPRRSVMLAEEDEKIALKEQDKIRAKLRGESLPELPDKNQNELPGSKLDL